MSDAKPLVIFTTLLIEKSPQALPLGAACVASSVKHSPLTKDFCNVQLVSFCKEDKVFEELSGTCTAGLSSDKSFSEDEISDSFASYIASELLKKNPKAVGFSVFVWNRTVLEKAAAILKEKGIKVIAGGPEVTARPETFSSFDFAVSGEGEAVVPRVIKNLLSESGSEIEKKSVSDSACDSVLEYSPYLDGTLDPSVYGGALWELARGCPFKCSYCYESKGSNKVRQFSLDRIEKELDLFAEKKVNQVFVLDPTYNANKERAVKLINLIAKKTPDTFYYFEARAEFIDRELARAFTKIPCALQIGLQSADENVLRLVNRPFNRKQFVKNISVLNEEGVVFGLDVIYGLPGDTFKGFKNSVDFAVSLYPNNLEVFCLSVLPGTDLYDRASELKLTFEEVPPYHIIKSETYSSEDLEKSERIAKACSVFYNEGRAVPWFNTILHACQMRASDFFAEFYDFATKLSGVKEKFFSGTCSAGHSEIEALQCEFISCKFHQKKLDRLLDAALDIIHFNGAYSRKTDTGKSETVTLKYPAEYIDSEYAMDLNFFVKNVKKRTDRVII